MPKVRPKGYLPEISNVNETRVKIAFCLYQSEEPMTMTEISKATKLNDRLVRYHLPILMKEGVIIKHLDKTYALQPFFYETEVMEKIYKDMAPVVSQIIRGGVIVDQIEGSEEQAIINCIQTLLHFVSIEVEEMQSR